jgi:hypothetical protein
MGWWLAQVKPMLVLEIAALPKVHFVLQAMQPPEAAAQVKKEFAQTAIQEAERRQVLQNQAAQAKPVLHWSRRRVTAEFVAWRSGLPGRASSAPAQRLSIASRD